MRIQNWSKVGALVVGIALTLPACTTLDAYTREEQVSHAQRQAVIGAAAGAVAGLITGDDSMERKKRALVGAGLGALAGAGVGTYMDRQEAKLRAELERADADRDVHVSRRAAEHAWAVPYANGEPGLGELPDLEDLGTAVRARALNRRAAVLHRDLLRILDLDLLAFLDAVALRHRGPPFSRFRASS